MRIVIAEDAALFRHGLTRLLEDAGHQVVGLAGDADIARELLERVRPDLVILDIRMPPDQTDDGVRLAAEAREHYPDSASCCSPSTSRPGTRWGWSARAGSATC